MTATNEVNLAMLEQAISLATKFRANLNVLREQAARLRADEADEVIDRLLAGLTDTLAEEVEPVIARLREEEAATDGVEHRRHVQQERAAL